MPRWPWITLAAACAASCATTTAQNEEEVLRSPSLDYQPETVRTSDGREPGADGMPVEERLEGSAAVTSDGPRLAPGWVVEDGEVDYHPEQQVGGHVHVEDESRENEPASQREDDGDEAPAPASRTE